MHPMTRDQYRAFLLQGTRTGKLATVRQDGRPHLAPVWFTLDGEDVVFNTWSTSAKAKILAKSNKVALCVDDERPPFSYVAVEGRAEISTDLAEIRHWATEIARRYMGDDQAEAFGDRNGVEGELLVRIKVDRVIAMDGVTD